MLVSYHVPSLTLFDAFVSYQTLWDLTPQNHADYLPTFSLVHSTEMMIRVMQEVKVREEEYNLVKGISASIEGLPSFISFAKRERRLLARGTLYRRHDQDGLAKPPDMTIGNARGLKLSPHSRARELSRRSVVLLNAINAWDAQRAEQTNSSVVSSLNSYSGTSASSAQLAQRVDSSTRSESSQNKGRRFQASLFDQERAGPHHQQWSLSMATPSGSKQSLVDVFVFTDLILLATPTHKRQGCGPAEAKEHWRLLEDVGMARILGVTERREVTQGLPRIF
jgi:hypothetical protein